MTVSHARIRTLTVALLLAVSMLPSLAAEPATAAVDDDPILFVHGYLRNASDWSTMIARFRRDGYTSSQLFAWEYDYEQSNAATAEDVADEVQRVLRTTGADKIDIVTHSMGALSTRYYLKNLGGTQYVDDWASIAGPNHGTTFASLCSDPSCIEMRIGSSFLKSLNRDDETPGATNYGTFWSACDEIITPNLSVLLSGADNTFVGCVGHLSLLLHAGTYREVRDFLD